MPCTCSSAAPRFLFLFCSNNRDSMSGSGAPSAPNGRHGKHDGSIGRINRTYTDDSLAVTRSSRPWESRAPCARGPCGAAFCDAGAPSDFQTPCSCPC